MSSSSSSTSPFLLDLAWSGLLVIRMNLEPGRKLADFGLVQIRVGGSDVASSSECFPWLKFVPIPSLRLSALLLSK